MSRRVGQTRRLEGAGRPADVGGEKGRPGAGARRENGPSVGLVMSFRERCGYFHAPARRPLRETGERWGGQPHSPPHYGTAVTVTEDPPMQGRSESPTAPAGAAAWWWLVTVSVVLLLVAAGTLAIWWAASRETRTTSYRVLGDLSGIRLDLGDADIEI